MPEPIVHKEVTKKTFSNGVQFFVEQVKENILDTIAYVFLIFGLLYCFFDPFVAGLLVGGILGIYFAANITRNAQIFKEFIIINGIFKGFTLLAAVAAFMITAPGICLGLVMGTGAKFIYGKIFSKWGGAPQEK